MALTPSTMMALGSPCPDFLLKDVVTQAEFSRESFTHKKGLLVMFICRHCPYVVHVQEELARLDRDYRDTPLAIVAISSNDASAYPEDSSDNLAKMCKQMDYQFPLLYDSSQEIAKRFKAACTPDIFLYNGQRQLVYRGQLDDSRPGNSKPSDGQDIRRAIEALLADKPISQTQKPSMGCNIKWIKGQEPDYFN